MRPLPVNAPGTTLSNKEPDRLRLAERRVWTLVAVFGAWQSYSSVLALGYGPTAFHVHDNRRRTFEAAAAALALVSSSCFCKARFDEQVESWLDPAMQDEILTRSLQFGDPRGDGIAGSYVTWNSLTKAIDDRDGKRHRRSELLLPLMPRADDAQSCRPK